jgi:PIN domain nuclease of toxin-antitoxin system
MRLILDTHILLWWFQAPAKLGAKSRRLIERSDCAVSVATLWEHAMKEERGKLASPPEISEAISRQGFRIIPVKPEHVESYRTMPASVVYPFDRMMVAVAAVEQLLLGTQDAHLLSCGLKGIREM